MRVFLDTNVLVSAVATRGLCADILHAVLAEHQLVLGEAVSRELQGVLVGKLGIPPASAGEMDEFLRREAAMVGDPPAIRLRIRDPGDVLIPEEAAAAQADVLVTGDRDLVDVAKKAPVRIVDPRGFWEQLRTGDDSPG